MTVPATARRAGPYNGNGSTTSFSFSFKTFAAGDLLVTKTDEFGVETTLVLNSDYSVTLNVDQDASPGGSITYPISGSALPSGQKLTIIGDLDYEQTTDLLGGGAFNAKVIEDTFDRTVIQIQQLEERLDRSLTVGVGSTADVQLPVPQPYEVLAWNSTGTALVNQDPSDFLTIAGSSGFAYQLFSGTGAQTSFTLNANPGSVSNLEVFVGGVRQVPVSDYDFSGTSLTFTSAPPSGSSNILVRWGQTLGIGTPSDLSVTTDKIADANVTTQKIADANVTTQKIADANVTTQKIADGAITTAKWASSNGQLAGMRNKIINGAMEIAQRGTSFAGILDSTYSLDRWQAKRTGTGVYTISQEADAPSNNEFRQSLRVTVTTADTSIAASDEARVVQAIEGFNARDLIGRTFTVSFWVRSSKTGVHCVSLRNLGNDRSFVAEYTVSVANTWEFKTITVSGGLITAGTWDWTNGVGLRVEFTLAAGSTWQTTAGAWQTGSFLSTTNQVNCLDTIGNIFAITGVQLEVGGVATPFEHRPFGAEVALCQRYYETGSFSLYAYGAASESFGGSFYFKTTKRSTPTIATSSVSNTNNSGLTVVDVSVDKGAGYATGTATARQALSFNWTAAIEL